MIFSRFSSREKKLFWMTSGIMLIYMMYIYLIEPGWNFISDLNARVLSKEIQLLKSKRVISQKDRICREYEKFDRVLLVKGSLEEEMAETLRELEMLAKWTGPHLIDIKPQPVKELTFYKRLTIIVEAEGDIEELSRFIYGICSSDKILRVQAFRIKARSGSRSILTAQLVIGRILGRE